MEIRLNNNQVYLALDTLGAELTSLQDVTHMEYLWQGDPAYWKSRAPILFPIVGRLRGDRAFIDGKSYHMPQHGLARRLAFEVVRQYSDMALLRLEADAQTMAQYPYVFRLEVCYALQGRTLVQRMTVGNAGDAPMPFCLGAHPGFAVPFDKDERLADYVVDFGREETCDSSTVNCETGLINRIDRIPVLQGQRKLALRHDLFYHDALILETLKSRCVRLYSTKSGKGVELRFEGFPYLGIWQAKDAPFLCLEPWIGSATCEDEDDEFIHKRGMIVLPPGETFEAEIRITLL